MTLTATLVTDGSSDRALVSIVSFLFDHYCDVPYEARHASFLPPPSQGLAVRIRHALVNFPCDILFVHRDAEGATLEAREKEIQEAVAELRECPPYICIIPVKMTEAWLLVDEIAIRGASGNPNGRNKIDMPDVGRIERMPDPKECLRQLLDAASNLPQRRRINFNSARQRVSELLQYELLRGLDSFRAFEANVARYFGERH